MKVSLHWLKELVDYPLSSGDLASELSLNSIGVKQQTEDYLELDLTYNRGDLLSMRGVAYEVAAVTESPLRFLAQTPQDFIWVGQNLPKVEVLVENEDLAPFYCVAKIENLRVEPSNKDWVKKLADCGLRFINNVADITNLIMVEYGQPMHAFDNAKVEDESLIVRTAQKGEKLTTLDGKIRELDSNDLLIADSKKPLGLAGVMGGKDSEVADSTTTILLEAAIFNPAANRGTSKRHGLYSDASKRFQHGLSAMRLLQALDAAIKMYQSIGGKLTAITLSGDFSQTKRTINLSIKRTNKLLGLLLDEETITSCLKKLGFVINKLDPDTLEVTPPYFRLDINIEEDLVEEVARMYGYEKIEGVELPKENIPALDQSLPGFTYNLKSKLKSLGLTEVNSHSFYSAAVLEALGLTTEANTPLVRVSNPISSETEFLRMDLWPNLLEVVNKNIKKGFKDIGVFEIGKVYYKEGDSLKETDRLSIALMNNTENPLEELYSFAQNLGGNLTFKLSEPPKTPIELFHPTRFVSIEKEGKMIAGAAEIHLRVLNKLGIEKRVAVLEIDLSNLI